MHALRPERLDRERGRQRRVDPARERRRRSRGSRSCRRSRAARARARAASARARPRAARSAPVGTDSRRGLSLQARARPRVTCRLDRSAPRAPRRRGVRAAAAPSLRSGRRRRRAAPPRTPARARAPRPRRRARHEWPSKISSSWPPTALHERDEARRVARALLEHLLALALLADVERRRRDVDEQLRAGQREVGRGRARLPHVLADRHADERLARRAAAGGRAPRRSTAARRRRRSSAGSACGRSRRLAVRADGARVVEVAVEVGEADERRDPVVAAAISSSDRRAARTNAGLSSRSSAGTP